MPSRCRLVLLLAASAFSLLAPGCASSPYGLAASSRVLLVGPRFTGVARPTLCPADAQPAIIDLHGPEKTPEWGCLLACAVPKQEYVTDVTRVHDGWYLEPTCQNVCDANEHRVSYLGFGHEAHCVPGAVTDPGQLATFAREVVFQRREQAEQDLRTQILAKHKTEDDAREADGRRRQYETHLNALEDELHAMETTPAPWSFELVQAHVGFASELDRLRDGMHMDSALHDSLIERAAAVDSKREQSEKILGVRRPRREPATDRASRIRSCQSSCDERADPCRASCASLAPGTCDSCGQVLTQCRTTCARTTT